MPRLIVDPASCTAADLEPAVTWLRRGGIVAFPTDTLYGLAVDPASSAAVRALFDVKGRAADVAVPLVAASLRQVERWCGALDAATMALARRFWPGPLSLIVDAPASVTPEVHAGRRSVAIRVPASRVAIALCEAWQGPVTATSANRSGALPAMSPGALGEIASDARVFVIDGGAAPGGPPSTIVDARAAAPVLVREGAIAWNRVLESLKE